MMNIATDDCHLDPGGVFFPTETLPLCGQSEGSEGPLDQSEGSAGDQ